MDLWFLYLLFARVLLVFAFVLIQSLYGDFYVKLSGKMKNIWRIYRSDLKRIAGN